MTRKEIEDKIAALESELPRMDSYAATFDPKAAAKAAPMSIHHNWWEIQVRVTRKEIAELTKELETI
jgi:hypothetical protein